MRPTKAPDINYEALLPTVSNRTNLDPESWVRAKAVLIGMDPRGCSLTRAAQAAGLTRAQFDKHVREIRENPDLYPEWAREIPIVVDSRFQDQADVLEDALWDRALNGTEKGIYRKGVLVDTEIRYDNRLAMNLLKRRDPAYRLKGASAEGEDKKIEEIPPEQLYQKMRNAFLVNQARESYIQQATEHGLLPKGMMIEGEARLAEEKKEKAELPLSEAIDNSITDDFEDLDL